VQLIAEIITGPVFGPITMLTGRDCFTGQSVEGFERWISVLDVVPAEAAMAKLGITALIWRVGDEVFDVVDYTTVLKLAKKFHEHHLFPRQFNSYFVSKGITIDDYTMVVDQTAHQRGIHGKGLGDMQGRWNKVWLEFRDSEFGQQATKQQVFDQMYKMLNDFGIHGITIQPYGTIKN
jgi:hypothetical protein